jgi:CHAT domain-containing protein
VFGARAAVLQYVVLPHRTHLLVTTATTQQVVTVNISRLELGRRVAEARKSLQRPGADPKPAAQALYRTLIAPIKPLLEGTGTLMISADDVLRYLPFAALHDEKHYLVELYAISNYSPTTRDIVVAPANRPHWRLAAFGASQAQPKFDFPALSQVSGELRAIVRQPGERTGALPGERKIDKDFNRATLSRALLAQFPAVHIASHFRLAYGTKAGSVLLLGDGNTIGMAELTDSADFGFGYVDLLTLSACQTAVPAGRDNATGIEVESLSALVHLAGARSVIATLWPVNDRTTADFMARFYAYLGMSPSISKAEALRRAQRDSINEGRNGTSRRVTPASAAGAGHPYYWAPFTLLGNWR